jgi:hypothetical protein
VAKKLCTPCCAQPDRIETKDDSLGCAREVSVLLAFISHLEMLHCSITFTLVLDIPNVKHYFCIVQCNMDVWS